MYPPPPGPPPAPRKSHVRRNVILIAVATVIVLFVALVIIGAVAGPPPEASDPATKPAVAPPATSQPAISRAPAPAAPAPKPTSAPPAARPAPTAQQVADRLAQMHPLPNPRDNTKTCAPACRGLVTTDAVSVYDWRDEATAKRWAATFGAKVRRVGPYVLSFAGSTQAMTSDEARADMTAELKRMLKAP